MKVETITPLICSQSLHKLALLLRQEADLSIVEFHGYLAGQLSTSADIMPDKLVQLFQRSELFDTMPESTRNLILLTIQLSNHVAISLYSGKLQPLLSLEKNQHDLSLEEHIEATQLWFKGYINGLGKKYCYSVEQSNLDIKGRFLEIMALLTFDRCTDLLKPRSQTISMREHIVERLPETFAKLSEYFQSLRSECEPQQLKKYICASKDEPCFCGSGKPFRKCCLH